jgi:hypothetical protein
MSAWDLHGQSWQSVAKRVWADIGKDKIFSHAAELAYYFLLALFPLLLFLTSVIGLLISSGTGLRHSLFDYLGKVLPTSASQLVSDTTFEVSSASGGGKARKRRRSHHLLSGNRNGDALSERDALTKESSHEVAKSHRHRSQEETSHAEIHEEYRKTVDTS